jgi:hypothetical protein
MVSAEGNVSEQNRGDVRPPPVTWAQPLSLLALRVRSEEL